jgi:citrate lyase subunit beta/citryl-CoA lyase
MKTPHSYLFVPGDRPERFAKACASGAQAVLIDLEDAVAPAAKDEARAAIARWLAGDEARALAAQPRPPQLLLRLNATDSPWHAADRQLLAHPLVRGAMLPKSESAADLVALHARLRADQVLLPLVETVRGWFQALELARAPGVQRLAFGSVDFCADSGIRGDGEELILVRSQLVLLSRLAGLAAPLDGVSLALDDAAALEADVQRARRFGFGGKLCIHPRQVQAVNTGFAPSPAEQAWARRVLTAVESEGLGAIRVDGKLVDKPVLLLAQGVLAALE